MKKILLLITILFAITVNANEHIKVITNNGFVCDGKMVKGNSNSIIVKANKHKYGADTLTFELKDIRRVILNGEDFVPYDDKLVAEKSLSSISLLSSSPIKYGYIDHNYATGKALKSAGGVTIALGIPCVATGAGLLIASKQKVIRDTEDLLNNSITTSNIFEYQQELLRSNDMYWAGVAIVSAGSLLTVIGIPLCVKGKKLMNLNCSLSYNNVGVTLQF